MYDSIVQLKDKKKHRTIKSLFRIFSCHGQGFTAKIINKHVKYAKVSSFESFVSFLSICEFRKLGDVNSFRKENTTKNLIVICDVFMVISHAPLPNERIQNENFSIVFGFLPFVSNGFEHLKTLIFSKALCIQ